MGGTQLSTPQHALPRHYPRPHTDTDIGVTTSRDVPPTQGVSPCSWVASMVVS